MDFVSLVRSTAANDVFRKKRVSDFFDLEYASDWNAPLPPIGWFRKAAAPESIVTHVDVGGVDVFVTALPAAVFEARHTGEGHVFCIQLDDEEEVINGVVHSGPTISIGGRASRFYGHWWEGMSDLRATAVIVVPDVMVPANWPKPTTIYATVCADPRAMATVRTVLAELVQIAMRRPDRLRSERMVSDLRTDLLESLDEALTSPRSAVARRDKHGCDRFESILSKIDAVFPHKEALEELVVSLGISEKSLYNTIKQLSGLTPYNLIRIRRLLAVRRSILSSAPGVLIKQHAIDSGYWHLGRFSKEYAIYFGETPSETLRRRGREFSGGDLPV